MVGFQALVHLNLVVFTLETPTMWKSFNYEQLQFSVSQKAIYY